MSCAKTAEPIKMPFGFWSWMSPGKHVLHRGAHWRNLANTIELYLFDGSAKTAEPIEMPFGVWTRMGPTKHVLIGGGAHWRNLANAIEPSMCGGDTAFLSKYFDHLF